MVNRLNATVEKHADTINIVMAIIFVAVFVILFMTLAVKSIDESHANPCHDPQSFTCLDQRVHECVASEKYTQEQCVILVGGNK